LRLDWVTHYEIVPGFGYGYTLTNFRFREVLQLLGVELDNKAKIAIHLCHPLDFKPVPGKKNILFTMTEGPPIQQWFVDAFKKADMILVPSQFCFDLFEKHRGKKPMFVNRLGFDDTKFKYSRRKWSIGDEFIFLYLGAPNTRKGWDKVMSAHSWILRELPFVKVIFKVSSETGQGKVAEKDGIIFDSRRYPDDAVPMLYEMSNAFVMPTTGEGFGLPMLEALATGLPVVTTRYSGQLDFLSEKNAYFCKHTFETVPMSDGTPFHAACADVGSLAKAMLEVIKDYDKALDKAELGSEFVRNNFTWKNAGRQLIKNINRMRWEEWKLP
jgi:glycosyltransferase involved in cell wall biosynthesis